MAQASQSDGSVPEAVKPHTSILGKFSAYPAVIKLFKRFALRQDDMLVAQSSNPDILFRKLGLQGKIYDMVVSCETVVSSNGELSKELCQKLAEEFGSETAGHLIADCSPAECQTGAEKLARAEAALERGDAEGAQQMYDEIIIGEDDQALRLRAMVGRGDCLHKLERQDAMEYSQMLLLNAGTSPEVLDRICPLVGKAAQYAAEQPKEYSGNFSRERLEVDLQVDGLYNSHCNREGEFKRSSMVDVILQTDLGNVCYAKESELRLVPFAKLKMEVTNRGKMVICRTVTDLVPTNALGFTALLEDAHGDTLLLGGYNILEDPKKQLPRYTYLAIKEPWYKLDIDYKRMIGVESISQLIWLPLTHQRLRSLQWKTSPDTGRATLDDRWTAFEAEADRFLAECCLRPAIASLQDAAELIKKEKSPDPTRRANLFVKQAEAYLKLRQPTECFVAAQAALGFDAGNRDALRLYVDANLQLSDFKRAKAALAKYGGSQAEIARVDKLLFKFEHPLHDLKGLLEEARASRTPRLLHPDFYDPGFEMRFIDDVRGRGLFATRRFKPGDLILVSKAFEVAYLAETCLGSVYNTETRETSDLNLLTLECKIMAKIRDNDDARKELYLCYAGPEYAINLKNEDSREQPDAADAQRVRGIIKFSAFTLARYNTSHDEAARREVSTCQPGDERRKCAPGLLEFEGSGVWIIPSLINHSCLPNSSRHFIGDLLILRAATVIKPGDEITTEYFCGASSVETRRDKMSRLGFACSCQQCEADTRRLTCEPQLETKREHCIKSFNEDFERAKAALSSSGAVTPAVVAELERKADLFQQKYAYKNRQDSVVSILFLKVASLCQNHQPTEHVRLLLKAYSKGIGSPGRGGATALPSTDSFVSLYGIIEALYLCGMAHQARDCFDTFKEHALILYGTDDPAILALLFPTLQYGIETIFRLMSAA